MRDQKITVLIKCEDQKGLVAKITNFFFNEGFNILSCQQHVNKMENKYFMRIHLKAEEVELSREKLEIKFDDLAKQLDIGYSMHYESTKKKVAIMAYKKRRKFQMKLLSLTHFLQTKPLKLQKMSSLLVSKVSLFMTPSTLLTWISRRTSF